MASVRVGVSKVVELVGDAPSVPRIESTEVKTLSESILLPPTMMMVKLEAT